MRQYAGNESLFPVSFGLVDDGEDDTALNRNVSAEALGDRTAWTRRAVLSVGVLSWPFRGQTPGNNLMLTAPIYDTFLDQWVAASTFELTPFYSSHDAGMTWTEFGTFLGAATVIVLGANPVTGRIIAFGTRAGVFYKDPGVDFWTGSGDPGMGDNAVIDRAHWMSGPGLFVVVGGTSNPAKAHIITSPNAQTWTSRDTQIPAALAQDTAWATAAGPSRIFACPRASGRSTFLTSQDGVTWRPVAAPLATNENVQDVAYNAMFDEFVVALVRPNGVRFLATRDGTVWQTRADIADWYPLKLVACGGAWIALGKTRATEAKSAQIRCSFNGGVSWRVASARLPGDKAAERYLLASSGGQCIATEGTTMIASQNMGL